MNGWYEKWFSTAGFFWGGPWGASLGVMYGRELDRLTASWQSGFHRLERRDDDANQNTQEEFFRYTFLLMGFLAQQDNRPRDQVFAAQGVLSHLRLNKVHMSQIGPLFDEGSASNFDWKKAAQSLKQVVGRRRSLFLVFLEIQAQAIFDGNRFFAGGSVALEKVALMLDVSGEELAQIKATFTAENNKHKKNTKDTRVDQRSAYAILGVKSTAKMAEIKLAYRRLMSEHHPDKLVSKGLPIDMIEIAKEKTQQIRLAYELICAKRGV